MKKSLIALAALAASGFAMAQSSVTLFGVVDANVAVIDGAQTTTSMGNSGNSSSRLGFRGVEDLGNGLKAGFHLEGAVGVDDGTGVGGGALGAFEFKRRSTVSLMGNFGEIRLGRDLTAAYSATSRYDLFGTVGVAGSGLWSSAERGFADVRRSNMLAYHSADFSGFKFSVNYAFGENVNTQPGGAVRTGDTVGVAGTYDNGPLSLGLGYQETGRTVVGGNEEKYWTLGGSYNFGVVKLLGAYVASESQALAIEGGGAAVDSSNYLIGLSAPVGAAGLIKATYNRYERDYNTIGTVDAKADQFSLGYEHSLSKRTAVYGTYTYLKNKNNNNWMGLGGAGNTGRTAANADVNGKLQAVQIGVRHNF